MMTIPNASSQERYRYWAFISYSWADKRQARTLHRQLERFVIPHTVRRSLRTPGPWKHHLRPVFLDEAEMAASGVLDQRLRDAIDHSAAMVLLASPASARSRYVDLEVSHFVTTRGFERLAIVVIGKGDLHRPPLSAALRRQEGEPLWIDCRDVRRPSRQALVRVAAIVLDVDFDILWGRHRRRRRWLLSIWSVLAVLAIMVVGVTLRQQSLAEQRTPERQTAAFREWYDKQIEANEGDSVFNVSRTEDINSDGLLDYFVDNHGSPFCGSGGCLMSVYVTRAPGDYVEVLSLLGKSTPRVRATGGKWKQILVTGMATNREPLYSVYTRQGEKYELIGYEFCDGIYFEYCSPTTIDPVPDGKELEVAPGTMIRSRPSLKDQQVTDLDALHVTVIGVLDSGKWYLVQGAFNASRGSAGFVPSSSIRS